ncbi:serine/threonine-protein kinase [Streptomyces sp. NPDC090306]|uniref:serine/threonine-protein kinase n=1 Tax=Streptomyces sp. NPDC090306 TaxID=3365961 RepID=UPI00382A85F9
MDGVREVFRPLRAGDPSQVAGYRIVARLGAGGMGRVYLAHTLGGRPVAVKVIRPELADDPDFRRRFGREIQAARRVRGAYTAEVLDADADGVPPWLATLYVPGPSLAEAVGRRGPLPVDAVLWLMAGVAEALQAIHGAGIVHRDLKPSNVLLASDGPRVIDFGISLTADVTSHTAVGAAVGTPEFMAPEQASAGEVTAATDVFALGQTAAYAALGEPLYGSGSSAGVLYRIVHSEPDLSVLPERVRPLIARCLENDPARRASLAEVVGWCRERLGPDADTGQGAGPAVWQELLGPETEVPPPPPPPSGFGPAPAYVPNYGYPGPGTPGGGAPPYPVPMPVPAPAWQQPEWVGRRWSRRQRAAAIGAAVLGGALLLAVLVVSLRQLSSTTNSADPGGPSATATTAAESRTAGTKASGSRAAGTGATSSGGRKSSETSDGPDPRPTPTPTASASVRAFPYALQDLDEKTSLSFTEPVARKDRKGDIRMDCKEIGCELTSPSSVIGLSYDKPGATLESCRSILDGATAHSLTLNVVASGSEICVRNASGDIALLVVQIKSTAMWDTPGISFVEMDMTVWRNLA